MGPARRLQWHLVRDPNGSVGLMFEGFEERDVDGIHLRVGGAGTPVLLLHGYPQMHVRWRHVAPVLVAAGHRVVCADLRGYGRSHTPPAGAGAEAYSKRTMASELVAVMAMLGHERFAVAGHDRGGRVAYRMALDHPGRVARLAVLDILPTIEQWDRLKGPAAVGAFHWTFLARPAPFPERLIGADPDYWLRTLCAGWSGGDLGLDEYVRAFTPDVIRASCDDYRAGAGIDVEIDRADRDAGRRIACPTLVLWGERSLGQGTPLEVWQRWADDVRGHGLPCGHFLPEEAPDDTASALRTFLAGA